MLYKSECYVCELYLRKQVNGLKKPIKIDKGVHFTMIKLSNHQGDIIKSVCNE